MDEIEVNRWAGREAIRAIRENPGRYLKISVLKIPRLWLNLGFDEGSIGGFQNVGIGSGAGHHARRLRAELGMDVVYPGLKADRSDAGEAEHFTSLLVPEVAPIHDTAVRLDNSIAIHRIVLEERKVRIEIKLIVLGVSIGKKLAAGQRVVVII
jgi:hypothetical protein